MPLLLHGVMGEPRERGAAGRALVFLNLDRREYLTVAAPEQLGRRVTNFG